MDWWTQYCVEKDEVLIYYPSTIHDMHAWCEFNGIKWRLSFPDIVSYL